MVGVSPAQLGVATTFVGIPLSTCVYRRSVRVHHGLLCMQIPSGSCGVMNLVLWAMQIFNAEEPACEVA